MAQITFENHEVLANEDESVLEALTRHGHNIPNGCRSGICQSCLMSLDSGELPPKSQAGLSSGQIALNYFLSCQCIVTDKLSVKRINDSELKTQAIVVGKQMISSNVLQLRIKAEIDYLPGQYITLWRDETVGRSYSIASVPSLVDYIECHIKVIEGGQFSAWARDSLQLGDTIPVQGPMGSCVFTAEDEQPLLLSAIGTGLAPIYGILKQALSSQHQGSIDLVIGAKNKSGFYLVDELEQLAQQHPNLTLHFLNQETDANGSDIYHFCKQHFPDLKAWRIFICGANSFVRKMHKQCFLSGAGMNAISADSFLPCSS